MRMPVRYYFLPAATILLVFACGVGLGLLLGGGSLASASTPGRGEHRRGGPPRGWTTMLKDLDLSDDQRTQLDALMAQQRTEIHAMCGDLRPKFEQIHARYDPLLREILTPEQWKRFEEARAEWRNRFGGPPREKGLPATEQE